ncbi:MAG: exonuclease SbcCD subunit D C-terminal domain-containing protein [Planctomycetes bacterium]|nr:exonuclease SbcCD subunit D C-terminal domain-containing protein [Planctomycetota bacterium]
MRLIHTSDWHLGHVLHEIPRDREHARFLAWLLEALDAEQADALLVAGDLFDAANPPADALRAFFGFVAAARRRRPRLDLVVIAGNHDSPARLDAPDAVLAALGVRVVGALPRARDGRLDADRLLVPLHDAAGAPAALVAAVPYLRPADLPPPSGAAEGLDALVEGARALYADLLTTARARRRPGQALLAMGHCYMTGTRLSELSERKILIGNEHPLPVDLFPDDVAYVALGHLHLAQQVGGRAHVRYSGAPLPLALDEARYPHQVLVVELDGERLAGVRELRVPRALDIRRIPESGDGLPLDAALAAIAALPARDDRPEAERPLLEVRVLLDRPEPGLKARLEAGLADRLPRLVKVTPCYAPRRADDAAAPAPATGPLGPEELFRRKHAADYGTDPSPDLLAAFHELLEAVQAKERP